MKWGSIFFIFSKKKISIKPLIKSAIPIAKVTINHTRSYQNSLARLTYRQEIPIKKVAKPVFVNFLDRMTQFEMILVNGFINIRTDRDKKKKK